VKTRKTCYIDCSPSPPPGAATNAAPNGEQVSRIEFYECIRSSNRPFSRVPNHLRVFHWDRARSRTRETSSFPVESIGDSSWALFSYTPFLSSPHPLSDCVRGGMTKLFSVWKLRCIPLPCFHTRGSLLVPRKAPHWKSYSSLPLDILEVCFFFFVFWFEWVSSEMYFCQRLFEIPPFASTSTLPIALLWKRKWNSLQPYFFYFMANYLGLCRVGHRDLLKFYHHVDPAPFTYKIIHFVSASRNVDGRIHSVHCLVQGHSGWSRLHWWNGARALCDLRITIHVFLNVCHFQDASQKISWRSYYKEYMLMGCFHSYETLDRRRLAFSGVIVGEKWSSILNKLGLGLSQHSHCRKETMSGREAGLVNWRGNWCPFPDKSLHRYQVP
jgi:hypothetical protein